MSPGKGTFLPSSSGAEGSGVSACSAQTAWSASAVAAGYCGSVGSGRRGQTKHVLRNLEFFEIRALTESTLASRLWKRQLVCWVGGGRGRSAFKRRLLQLMFLLLSRTHQTAMTKVSWRSRLFLHTVQQCECLPNAPS